ncbi:MAG: hypothetical protein QG656_2172, partial [Candidatus Hydrogenedentes bacterium]|nr:hypothetical protein [Candidatus Hydrogenedentota bacterium]
MNSGMRRRVVVLLCLVFCGVSWWSYAAPKSSKKAASKPVSNEIVSTDGQRLPWGLRDHFVFSAGLAKVKYAVLTAEWSLDCEGIGTVIDNAGFEVVLGDGTVLRAADLGSAVLDRATFDNGTEKGGAFTMIFPPKDGLVVYHGVRSFTDEPFLEFWMKVENKSEKPVTISALRPIVFGPGCIVTQAVPLECVTWPFAIRGTHAVHMKDKPALLSFFYDKAGTFCLAMGGLIHGTAVTGGTFAASGGSWQGAVSCSYEPALVVAPGASVESDPIWISTGETKAASVVPFYVWECREENPPAEGTIDVPRCWAAAADDASANDVTALARAWSDGYIKHVLVPYTWEGRPGSMQGAAPRYPKEMSKVAADLRALKMTPGLALDPLVAVEGDSAWSALSVDGRRWLNVSAPEGRDECAKRIQKVIEWGFGFVVLQHSAIPDEVLQHFGMTRNQADWIAFEAGRSVAGKVAVLPSPSVTLGGDWGAWLEAANGAGAMDACQLYVGPVRLDAKGLAACDENLSAALRLFNGPIEVVGEPKKEAREDLGRALALPALDAQAVDASNRSPRLWYAIPGRGRDFQETNTVVMFPGAPAWTLDDLKLPADEVRRVWRSDTGAYVDSAAGPVPAAEKLTVYGATRDAAYPVLLGAASGPVLMFDDLKILAFNETPEGEGSL